MRVKFDRRFTYFFAMHIDAYFSRGEKVNLLVAQEIENLKKNSHSNIKWRNALKLKFHASSIMIYQMSRLPI